MKKRIRYLSLRLDPVEHYKLDYVAQYEGRTMSGLIKHLIHRIIRKYEKKYGEIELPPGIR